jgi:hypothetical protein
MTPRRVASAPDEDVLALAARVVEHTDGRPQTGSIVSVWAIHDRSEPDELVELGDARLVEGGIFGDREQIIVLRRGAKRTSLTKPSRDLAAMLASQSLELIDEDIEVRLRQDHS